MAYMFNPIDEKARLKALQNAASPKVDNDTRPYSTPNANYQTNAVSPIVEPLRPYSTPNFNYKVNAVSPEITPTIKAQVPATSPLLEQIKATYKEAKGITDTAPPNTIPPQPKTDYEKQMEDAKKTYEETIAEIQSKTSGTPSGNSGIVGVNPDIYNQIMAPYQKSQSVINAENYLNQLRESFNGRTRYSDQLDALIGDYQNRDKFNYDPNADMLYQNYLSAMQNNGLQAMKDTMGQAASLTGGYGSTYATAAANGAYNSYLQQANDNLPQFYNMAADAYNMEGQEMLNNINLLQNLDANEYNRALQNYEMALRNADTAYERDYNNWKNNVANAMNVAGYQNSDAWKQASMDADALQRESDMAWKQYQLAMSQIPQTQTELSDYEKQMQALKLEEQRIKNGTLQTEWDTKRGIDSNGNPIVQSESTSTTSTGKAPTVTETQKALKYLESFDYKGISSYLDSLQAAGKDIDAVADFLMDNSPKLKKSDEGKFLIWDSDDSDKYQINGSGKQLKMSDIGSQFGLEEDSDLYKALQKKLKESKVGDEVNLFELILDITTIPEGHQGNGKRR